MVIIMVYFIIIILLNEFINYHKIFLTEMC